MRKQIGICITLILFVCCSVEPKPIQYGVDNCHYCDMTIVDDKHSAELVTTKGKVYKFDAIECMIRYLHTDPQQQYKHLLVADFSQPGILVDANKSYYLVSKNLPSPMGEFLSGFNADSIAENYQISYKGTVYSWQEINSFIMTK